MHTATNLENELHMGFRARDFSLAVKEKRGEESSRRPEEAVSDCYILLSLHYDANSVKI
jgi:hypothetical protein